MKVTRYLKLLWAGRILFFSVLSFFATTNLHDFYKDFYLVMKFNFSTYLKGQYHAILVTH